VCAARPASWNAAAVAGVNEGPCNAPGAECAIAVERRWSCDKTETRFHDAWVRCAAEGKAMKPAR